MEESSLWNVLSRWQCRFLTLFRSIILRNVCYWKKVQLILVQTSFCWLLTELVSSGQWENLILTNVHTYHRWHQCCKMVTKIGGKLGWVGIPLGRTILSNGGISMDEMWFPSGFMGSQKSIRGTPLGQLSPVGEQSSTAMPSSYPTSFSLWWVMPLTTLKNPKVCGTHQVGPLSTRGGLGLLWCQDPVDIGFWCTLLSAE